jgi:hypothetical protein
MMLAKTRRAAMPAVVEMCGSSSLEEGVSSLSLRKTG